MELWSRLVLLMIGVLGFENLSERHVDRPQDRLRCDAMLVVVRLLGDAATIRFIDARRMESVILSAKGSRRPLIIAGRAAMV